MIIDESLVVVENNNFDLSFIEENLVSLEEVQQVNSGANYPVEREYWLHYVKEPNSFYSYYICCEEERVAHFSLKFFKEKKLYLCFYLVAKKYRYQGLGKKCLKIVEDFTRKRFTEA